MRPPEMMRTASAGSTGSIRARNILPKLLSHGVTPEVMADARTWATQKGVVKPKERPVSMPVGGLAYGAYAAQGDDMRPPKVDPYQEEDELRRAMEASVREFEVRSNAVNSV